MLKIIKRNQEQIRAERMSEGLSGTGVWGEIKRILGHHNALPNTVDGKQGGFDIADIFQEKYKSLYNSVSFDSQQTVGRDQF